MNNYIPNNVIRQLILLLIILLLGIVLFNNLKFFLPAFLGAYTLFVIMRKFMFTLQSRYKWNRNAAAALLMVTSFLVILLPILLLINLMSSKVAFAIQHSSEVVSTIQGFVQKYEKQYGIEVLTTQNLQRFSSTVATLLPQILASTFNTVMSILIMYFILYFMLVDGKKMEAAFFESVPLKDENLITLRKDLNGLVLSNALGIPLIAIVQGIVAIIGYFILGVEEPVFWFVITCIGGMLPVIGAALGYIPLTILFFANGDSGKGVIMLLYGFIIIGLTDNVFRMILQKKLGDVHPMITVFGVLAGVTIFGFIGLIFGPILISLFLLLIKIYLNEFNSKK